MRHPIRIAVVILCFVALYLLLPFSFGVLTQHYSTQFLKNENETLGKVLGIHLRFDQYHLGWFHSEAQLQIEKKNNLGAWVPLQTLPVNIAHGPVLSVGKQRMVGIGSITLQAVKSDEHSPYQFNIQDIIRFNGERATIVFVNNPAVTTTDTLKIPSLLIHVKSNLKADQFHFHVLGNGMYFQDPNHAFSVNIDNIDFKLAAHYLQQRHWKMTLGAQFKNNTISFLLHNNPKSKITINAKHFDLLQLHFDTIEIAKLLGELTKMQDASEVKKPFPPSAGMALFQQLLVQMVHSDTSIKVDGLQAITPFGELHAQYDAAFPTLPKPHDYFDIATQIVSQLKISIPSWSASFPTQNKQFSLYDLQYLEKYNTVFSHHAQLSLSSLDLTDLNAPPATVFNLTKLLFNSETQGCGDKQLSQLSDWTVLKLCVTTHCFNQLNGNLKFLNLNFNAFRNIAKVTQQLVQYDQTQPGTAETKWIELVGAYAKLILANSSVQLSYQMQTPHGSVQLTGNTAWPRLKTNLSDNHLLTTVLDQSVYQLHLSFPAIYVDQFLHEMNQQKASPAQSTTAPAAHPDEPSPKTQVADFLQYAIQQGYLKKTNGAYQSDLAGKGAALTINGVAWKMPS